MLVKPETEGYRSCTEKAYTHSPIASTVHALLPAAGQQCLNVFTRYADAACARPLALHLFVLCSNELAGHAGKLQAAAG